VSTSYSALQPRRPGRPPACSLEIVIHVVELRLQGLSYADISVVLNREGIPTPAGRPVWQKSYVDRLLHTRYAREIWNRYANLSLEAVSAD
jgi:hypothetical protein